MIQFFRISVLLAVLFVSAFFSSAYAQATGGRISYSVNDNWKFHLGGLEYADNTDFNDAGWESIDLPHTWNNRDPFDDDETYVRGIGWYRKTIELSSDLRGKKIYLFFEGANQVADVYVNGAFAGQHKGGYTGFSIDITRFLQWDNNRNKNLIAVQVNNAHDNWIPPLSVGYALYGGIYRNVWVIATDSLHFKEINNSASSVFVTTPQVNNENATVLVKASIVNQSTQLRKLSVVNTVMDAEGKIVSEFAGEVNLGAGEEQRLPLSSGKILHPILWSPEHPYLYTIRTQLLENGKVVENVSNPLGFRWFRFSPDSGFFLNGQHYVLHGTNRHQDRQGKGSALSEQDQLEDMRMIKDMGANFIRLAHYPQAPEVLRLADKMGLLIWEENPVVNYMNPDPAFLANAQQMMLEMIHQQYDHPSIMMWGSMNEILLNGPEGDRIQKHVADSAYVRVVRDYAVKLDSTIRAEDPSRYSTMAMHGSGDYAKYGIDQISQVKGYNIYSGWYGGRVEEFGPGLDKDHRNNPGFNMFVSEYGAEGEVQLNTEHPKRMDYSGQYQQLYHESYLRQINQRPYLAGTAVWNEFDFSQPNIGGPTPHRNQKGLVTWDRHPKDVYYLYKANWNQDPMVYIATRNWRVRAGEAGKPSTIDVYSNLPGVVLTVNGNKLANQSPNDIKKCSWQVLLKDGPNRIQATGKQNGKIYQDQIIIDYQAYQLPFDNVTPFAPLAINAGAETQYLDPTGMVWMEDRPYTKGGFGYLDGSPENFSRTQVIKKTNDVPLYYSFRDSLTGYRFDVPDGQYTVTLCFAESSDIGAGQRLFDVFINDKPVIEQLDLAAEYGYAVAAKRSFIVQVNQGQGIQLHFKASKGSPTLSGIKIEK